MSSIRALERSDVERVASLYELVARSGEPEPNPKVVAWLHRVVLDQPWADAEIPSLVATDANGEVVGFLASHVRRLCMDGQPVRLACSGQLVVHPRARNVATGTRLQATYLRGPQDLSITDGATEDMSAIWEGLGGERAPLQQLTWLRPVTPWRHPLLLAQELREIKREKRLPVAVGPVPALAAGGDGWRTEPLTPHNLLAALPALTARLRLTPAYDLPFLRWILAELPLAGLGAPRAALVRKPDGTPVGFYVYYARPGGLASVIALAAPTDQASRTVLEALLADARACGVALVRGRVEPRLLTPVTRARALLVRRSGALVHARDPRLLQLVGSRHALLTQLDGEWCLRPQAL